MKHQQIQQKQQRWIDLIKKVDNVNLDIRELNRVKEYQRKNNYRSNLDDQIQQRVYAMREAQRNKQLERSQIEEIVNQEKQAILNLRMKKIRTEKKYQTQNWELKQNYPKRQQNELYKQSPFVKLMQDQHRRSIETKNRFKEQNKLNDIQIKLKMHQKAQRKQIQKKQRQNYERYIESGFQRRDQQINRLKTKYIFNHGNTKNNNRSDFRGYQIESMSQKKFQGQTLLNERQRKIHTHADVCDSSPAYLGRDYIQPDRQKQLKYLDKSLNRTKRHNKTLTQQKLITRSSAPNPEQQSAVKKQKLILPTVNSIKYPQKIQRLQLSSNNANTQSIKPQQYSLQKREYKHYDFISCRSKSIFV